MFSVKSNFFYKSAISSIPRILSNMNRNPLSASYGCMHRDYWMYKTSDFADAIRQFPTYSLSLIYKNRLNFHKYDNENFLNLIIASLDFSFSIQHKDGSFDEFYPNERGWVGPTAFLTFSLIETINNIKSKISSEKFNFYKKKITLSLNYIARGDFEGDNLANHHAMASLSLWKGYKLTKNYKFFKAYRKSIKHFLTNYHIKNEGWSIEYDGIDPGYLSATISFFAKIYKDNKDVTLKKICLESIETLKYFFYPNYHFGGSTGSRNTQHIYTHGLAIFYQYSDTAKMLLNLSHIHLEKKTQISPEVMSDRYFGYRIPEYLETCLQIKSENIKLSKEKFKKNIPYQQKNFIKFFKKANVKILNNENYYAIINLAKGGLIKYFDKRTKKCFQDSGLAILLENGKYLTSQNINKSYTFSHKPGEEIISGNLNYANNEKSFNVFKNILFRSFLLTLYIFPFMTNYFKHWIRSILIYNKKKTGVSFVKEIFYTKKNIIVKYKIRKLENFKIKKLFYNCDIFSRYVPQSQFFQPMQLLDKKLYIEQKFFNNLKNDSVILIETDIKKNHTFHRIK